MLLICYIKCYIKLKLGYIPSERPSTLICGTCLLVGAHYISRASGNLMIAKHLSPRALQTEEQLWESLWLVAFYRSHHELPWILTTSVHISTS